MRPARSATAVYLRCSASVLPGARKPATCFANAQFTETLQSHYIGALLRQLYKIVGSFDFLGDPVGVISQVCAPVPPSISIADDKIPLGGRKGDGVIGLGYCRAHAHPFKLVNLCGALVNMNTPRHVLDFGEIEASLS